MLSPLIPLYIEEAWHYTPSALKREDAVYKLGWFKPKLEWSQDQLAVDMKLLGPLKEGVLKLLEDARKDKYISRFSSFTIRLIGNSLQADLVVSVPESSKAYSLMIEYGTCLLIKANSSR